MKYKFQVENKPIEVEITNSATFHSETALKINHANYNVCVGDMKNNEVTSFMLNNKLYHVELEKNHEGYPTGIYVNGEYYEASLLKIDRLFYYKEKKTFAILKIRGSEKFHSRQYQENIFPGKR
jgi:hypothetical protein